MNPIHSNMDLSRYSSGVFELTLGSDEVKVPAYAMSEVSVLGDAAVFVSAFVATTSSVPDWTGAEFGKALRYDRVRGLVEELEGDSSELILTGWSAKADEPLTEAASEADARAVLREMSRLAEWRVQSGTAEAFVDHVEYSEFVAKLEARGLEAL